MRVITRSVYGGPEVLRLEELGPVVPAAGEVVVDVHASSVSAGDVHLLRGTPRIARLAFGLFRPKHRTPGTDVAGTVAAVGPGVTALREGDRVFGELSESGFGAWTSRLAVRADRLAQVPPGVDLLHAAAAPVSALTALQALRERAVLAPGQSVLVTGASGGVGSMAVQIATAMGGSVTAVTSTAHVGAVRALGAQAVIDRNREDFAVTDARFDVIVDCAGYRSYAVMRGLLAAGGRYVFVGGGDAQIMAAMVRGRSMLARPNVPDLNEIAGMIDRGSLSPLLSASFPLERTADAVRHFESGAGAGKVTIVMREEPAGLAG